MVNPTAAVADSALAAVEGAPLPPPPVALDPGNIPYWLQVRNSFPVRRDPLYVNNGGLGPSPYESIHMLKRMIDQQELECSTLHSGVLWNSVKEKAGRCLGCDADEIAYTRNATEGINIIANGLPLKEGDEVITTTHEHVGNTIAWVARQKRDGIVIKTFTPSMESAEENIKRMKALITKRTRAFNVTHVSTVGQLMPVNEIGKLAAKHGIYYFVDGAQAPGMMPVDVRAIGCHAYATSGHKWLLGPKGTGLLYVRKDTLDEMDAKFVGAYSATGKFSMTTGEYHLIDSAQRYEYGTVNAPLFAGLGASMEFLLRIGLDNVWAHNHALARAFMDGLTEIGARIITPLHPDEHSSMITFKLDGVTQAHLSKVLRQEAKLVIRGIYEGGFDAIRISFHAYNNFDDVEQVLAGVRTAKATG
jgi:selenocysteine lyase/cysteine desulfurase